MSEFPHIQTEQVDDPLDSVNLSAEELVEGNTARVPRQLEISHHGQVDIVLNHDAALAQQWGGTLIDTFRDGIPSSWEVIGGGDRHVMAGEVDGKEFVVKLRNKRLLEGDAQVSPEEWSNTFVAPRKQVYAAESIVNEMKLAPVVKAALATDEVQQEVQQLGFNGVSLVEPILGVIARSPDRNLPYSDRLAEFRGKYRPTTDKYLVYEYIAGVIPDADQGKVLEEVVGAALRNIGIDPEQGDLRPDHFIIDATGRVHLLDTEMYTMLDPGQSEDDRRMADV
jgi:hypothetical protein